jgi:chitin disaccharide deacetylase
MLIINADDFGAVTSTTDAVCEAFDAAVITSTSGMVWMSDSVRAAGIAAERGFPLGLHLNLSLPFSARDVPRSVQDRQLRLTEVFTRDGWWKEPGRRFDPKLLRDAIDDQVERFCKQFGQPTHIDGHHHVHLYEAVLDLLPRTWPIRPPLRAPERVDAPPNRRERHVRRRFCTPDIALALDGLRPVPDGAGLELLDRAHKLSVEVMAHPRQPHEMKFLMSPECRAVLDSLTLGSYGDLRPAVGQRGFVDKYLQRFTRNVLTDLTRPPA